jgi:hypothetical protein
MPIPVFVQGNYHKSSNPNGPTGNAFKIPLIDPSLSGNCLVLDVAYPHGSTVSSITDDQSNSWSTTPDVSVDAGVGNLVSAIFVLKNAAANTRMITFNFSAAVASFKAHISEYYNVDQTTPTSGTKAGSTTQTTGGTISTGAFTPSTDNTLIHHFSQCNDQSLDSMGFPITPVTGVTPGTGFTLMQGDRYLGTYTQDCPQTTAASINPGIALTGASGRPWNSLAVALRGASAGTAPSPDLPRIRAIWHLMKNDLLTSTPWDAPTVGNTLLVGTTYGRADTNLTAVSDTASNTFKDKTVNAVACQMFAAAPATPALSNVVTITTTAGALTFEIWDILNGGTYDKATNGTGTQSGTSDIPVLVNHTVLNPGGVVVMVNQFGTGPASGAIAGSDGLYDSVWFTGQDDTSSDFDTGDCIMHVYPTIVGDLLTFGTSMANGTGGTGWDATAFEFAPPVRRLLPPKSSRPAPFKPGLAR